jgi:uncharacterized protein
MQEQELARVVEDGDAHALRRAADTSTLGRDSRVDTPRGRLSLLEAALWREDAGLVAAVLTLPGPEPLDVLPTHGTWAWVREAPADVVHLLLDQPGADPHHPDADGRTALIELASADGEPDPDVAERIIAAGAADHRAEDGTTAFFHAVLHRHFDLARRLLTAGADPNTASRLNGWTALITAVALGLDDVVAWLLGVDNLEPNCADSQGATALHHAARLGPSAALAALLGDPRVDLDVVDGAGRTPLAEARRLGHVQGIAMLQQRGAAEEPASAASVDRAADALGHPHRRVSIPHRTSPKEEP